MNKINKDIRTKLYYEWHYSPIPNGDTMLCELHGYANKVDAIVQNLIPDIRKILINHKDNKIKKKLNHSFTNNINIEFLFTRGETTYINAGYLNKSEIDDNGRFKDIFIKCNIIEGDEKCSENELLAIIAHELTHAYEDYNRRIKKQNGSFAVAKKNGYNKLDNYNSAAVGVKKLRYLLYYTTDVEQNAYIAEIIKDIEPYLPDCDTSKKAWQTLSKSATWRNIQVIEKWVSDFNGGVGNEDVVSYWNHVTGENLDTYDRFLNHLNKRWLRFRKKLINRLSKQIHDKAMENPNWSYLRPSSTQSIEDLI